MKLWDRVIVKNGFYAGMFWEIAMIPDWESPFVIRIENDYWFADVRLKQNRFEVCNELEKARQDMFISIAEAVNEYLQVVEQETAR